MVKSNTGFLKRALCAIISAAVVFGLISINASAETALEDGTYTVPVALWNASSDEASMANGVLKETAELSVSGGVATIYIYTQELNYSGIIAYLTDLQFSNGDETYTSAKVEAVDENGYPTCISYVLSNTTDTYIDVYLVSTFMPAKARLKIDWDNLVQTSSTLSESSVDSTASASSSSSSSESESSVAESATLSDGTYKIDAKIMNGTSESMAGVIESAYITVAGSKATVTLNMQSIYSNGANMYLCDLMVDDGNGGYVEATVTDTYEGGYVAQYQFDLPAVAEETAVTVLYVVPDYYEDGSDFKHPGAAMVRTLTLDFSSAVLVEDDESSKVVSEEEKQLDKDNLDDGIYEVSVDLWNASLDQASMASAAVIKTARIVVKDGVYTMYLYTKPMTLGTITASLIDLKISNGDGTYTAAVPATYDSDGNPTSFVFVLPSTSEYIDVLVNPYVDVMGNTDIAARLKIDWSTLKAIADDTDLKAAPADTGSTSTASTSSTASANTVKTGDSAAIVSIALVLIVATGIVIYKRRVLSVK